MLASCANPSFQEDEITLIPKPLHFQLHEQSFKIQSSTPIFVSDESQQKAATYLKGMLQKAAGFDLEVSDETQSGGIAFEMSADLAGEAYQLEVTPKQIRIKASGESGFFYAVQTLRQLLPAQIESKTKTNADWLVPCVSVEDEPRFTWRGMHMDFSRHFFTLDEVKEFLDYMALYKLNTYHMHLTDDQGWRIEIKKYPLLTEKGAWRIGNDQDSLCMDRAKENELFRIAEKNYHQIDGQRMYGGFFTQEQIKEIVRYADERCITVVPEIDMPGHFKSAIDNYPFLSCKDKAGWATLFSTPACLGKETTYQFMENVLAEVTRLFPGKYIHIGGDEVNIKSWTECPKCQAEIKKHELKDEHELQSHFNRRIEKFLQANGKQLMGWDEIVRGGLSKDASMMWWRNWAPEAPKIAADNGNDIVMTPDFQYYFDFLNEGTHLQKVYDYRPVPDDFTPKQAAHILGVQANLWSERIPNFKRLQYQTFPRIMALAETGWTTQEAKDYDDFFKRVQKQYPRMDVMDIHYYIPSVEGLEKKIVFVDSAVVALNLSFPLEGVEIYYTLDGTVPTRNSLRYTDPLVVKKSAEIKAIAYRGDIFNDFKATQIEQQSYREASAIIPGNKGLKRWYVKGKFKAVEDLKVPDSGKWEKAETIDLGNFANQKDFSLVYQGFFKASGNGVYEFELRSDGGSLMYLGDDLLVDNGGYHGPRKTYAKVALKKGWHPFTVRYLPSSNPRVINAWFTNPGKVAQPLDDSVCGF
jgi:hexosaminidase